MTTTAKVTWGRPIDLSRLLGEEIVSGLTDRKLKGIVYLSMP